ncbi:MAG: DNA repair helicase [Podoviridae sp. ctviO18]|nr:MAG: DNA repair helicase [Podoviridae sp. ctviO18]
MKLKDETTQCPRCGKPQSKRQYEEYCCWDCGSTAPLPKPQPSPKRDMGTDSSAGDSEVVNDTIFRGEVDESKIKKMSEL